MLDYQVKEYVNKILAFDKPEFQMIHGADLEEAIGCCNKGKYNGINFVVLVTNHCLVTTGYRFVEVMIHMADDSGKMAESEAIVNAYVALGLTPVFKQRDQYDQPLFPLTEKNSVETWCYLLSTNKEISKETRSHEIRSNRIFL